MLHEYLDTAMQHAQRKTYDDGSYFGEIPGFQGVWGHAATEQACRAELRVVLEEWALFPDQYHGVRSCDSVSNCTDKPGTRV